MITPLTGDPLASYTTVIIVIVVIAIAAIAYAKFRKK